MPTTAAHASLGTARELLQRMDASLAAVPEVTRVVGKLGRVDSVLDPAPVSMFETMVFVKPEWGQDPDGSPVRLWRPNVRSREDLWGEIAAAARLPGLTPAPFLQPIETRRVMLQTGMRSRIGLKLRGPSIDVVDAALPTVEAALRGVSALAPGSVVAERSAGTPQLELVPDRAALSREGLTMEAVQETFAMAVGGVTLGVVREGRARRALRVRAERDARMDPEAILALPILTPGGGQVPLGSVAELRFARGPQHIRSEDTFPTRYVMMEPAPGVTDVDAVAAARAHLRDALARGDLVLPEGVSWRFAGTFENALRAQARLAWVMPAALLVVLLLLYLQFRSVGTSLGILAGAVVSIGGALAFLWLYGRGGLGPLGALVHAAPVQRTAAVGVGVVALIGIVVDDGVVLATYLRQRFREAPTSVEEVRAWVLEAGTRRLRPCLLTTATTLLALMPVLTASGRGADLMRPMALPVFGGMLVEPITLFIVPALWAARWERRLSRRAS
ncbi:MAG: efflux RND transporter permease subunit [Myxococcota bacterium]